MSNDSTNSEFTSINKATKTVIGVFLLVWCILSLVYYIYVVWVIYKNKLWKQHSFYLWFISISLPDIAILILYTYGSFTVIYTYDPPTKQFAIVLGWFYTYFDILGHLHFPIIAAVRMIAVVFPVKSKTWLTVKTTVISILALWVINIGYSALCLSFRGFWIWFNPDRMTMDALDYDLLIEQGISNYWLISILSGSILSLTLYSICIYKLRKKNPNIQGNSLTSKKAEKSMVTISLVLVVDSFVDWVLWYNCLASTQWWMPLFLTFSELLMYTLNSLLISTLSSEIFEKTFIAKICKKIPKKPKSEIGIEITVLY